MSGCERVRGRASGQGARRAWACVVLLAPAAFAATAAAGAAAEVARVVAVAQKGRAFAEREVHVERGGTVRFTNGDDFPHQVAVAGPGMAFDSDLQGPGEPIVVVFPKSGTFAVRCGIHPKMRMLVHVP